MTGKLVNNFFTLLRIHYKNNLNRHKRLFDYFGIVLIAGMYIFPGDMYAIKICCMIGMMLTLYNKRPLIDKNLLLIIALMFSACTIGTLSGIFQNSINPTMYLTINFIWPIIILIYISQLTTKEDFNEIINVLVVCHCILVIYDILYAFSVILGYSFPNINPDKSIPMFSFYAETSQGMQSRMNFVNLNSITFSSPLIILLWLTNYKCIFNKFLLTILVLLTIFLSIISGRRSLMLLFVISIPLCWLFSKFINSDYKKIINKKIKLLSIIVCSSLVVVYVYKPEIFSGYLYKFERAFNNEEEPTKFAQQKALISIIKDNPLFGVGIGQMIYEPSPGRTKFMNKFELMYHLWGAQTGIVGLSLYILCFWGLLFYGVYVAYKRQDIQFFFFLIGYMGILIAHATNPVMNSFDFFLSFYLCLAKLNYDLIYNKKNEKYISNYSFIR